MSLKITHDGIRIITYNNVKHVKEYDVRLPSGEMYIGCKNLLVVQEILKSYRNKLPIL